MEPADRDVGGVATVACSDVGRVFAGMSGRPDYAGRLAELAVGGR